MLLTTTPKALLLAALDEVGEEPLFHLAPAKQQRALEAASLGEILERGFNVFDVPVRSERRAPLFAAAVAAAEALDASGVRTAVTEIAAVCRAEADAWFAAHSDGPLVRAAPVTGALRSRSSAEPEPRHRRHRLDGYGRDGRRASSPAG